MKKSLLWVVLMGLILVIDSCKKDDDPPPAIVGTWTRNEYEFTDLPAGFTKYWEGFQLGSLGETNYVFVIRADGTYTRVYTLDPDSSVPSLNDTGKWTIDGTSFKLVPDKSTDLDTIEKKLANFPGTEFTLVGDINDTRFVVSQVLSLGLASDAIIDERDAANEPITDADRVAVDVTVLYKFDKVK